MLVKTPLYRIWKNKFATGLKRKRLAKILALAGLADANRKIRILEVGCANGQDALQFLDDADKYELVGVDIIDSKIPFPNFTFVQADASKLPFEDNSFDLVISIGLLEHIEPIENLCKVISEMHRVGKAYVSVVPSVSTLLEPHAVSLRWPVRMHKKMVHKYAADIPLHLNFFSDHTWSKFEGFMDADIQRQYYLFPFIKNTFIYGKKPNA